MKFGTHPRIPMLAKTRSKTMRTQCLLILLGFCFYSAGSAEAWPGDGHIKYDFLATKSPAANMFGVRDDALLLNHGLELRLNTGTKKGAWSANASYQLQAVHDDQLGLQSGTFGAQVASPSTGDSQRWLNLSEVLSETDDDRFLHRLDRLTIGYRSSRSVIKLGRQAISWGNGLVYNPMDFLNPFDPAAIDTEYKTGEDMLYWQQLQDSGNDLQVIAIGRRNAAGSRTNEDASLALKYHALIGVRGFDLLLAEHRGDSIIAAGFNSPVGSAVARGDWVSTRVDGQTYNSLVANISYSWVALNRNVSGHLEYFRNGFGIRQGRYQQLLSSSHLPLRQRLQRNELFTVGREYLAASVTLEMTPLWSLSPSLFYNLSDNSGMLQLAARHNMQQNLQLLSAIVVPAGPSGTEFGGLDLAAAGDGMGLTDVSISWAAFAQLGVYF
ncbi:MAG: hypothetical protein HKN50_13560 [Gammaproteobacteria bacterium]|nr:hypothetical protein [Gammaproteobacteria bacterium]